MKLQAGAATDVGLVRSKNQDQMLVSDGLFAVADGMGGHAAGEVASLTAVQTLRQVFEASSAKPASLLSDAAVAANTAVWEQAHDNPEMHGMGTTLVALALVDGESGSELAVVSVGDSRVYTFRAGELVQLTIDHSLVQELVDEGQINEREAAVHPQRHVLTRALGVEQQVSVDLLEANAEIGDRFVLCSDGLIREVSESQMSSVLRRISDPSEAARELVALARAHGGSDNITVVVVDAIDDRGSSDARFGRVTRTKETEGSREPVLNAQPESLEPSGAGPYEPGFSYDEPSKPPPRPEVSIPTSPLLTARVVGFFLILLLVVAGGVGALAWYAKSTYYVTIQNSHLVIFRGRPGGVFWLKPTLQQTTNVSSSSVPPEYLPALKVGQQEPSLAMAEQYIANLQAQEIAEHRASQPPVSSSVAPPTSNQVTTTTSSPSVPVSLGSSISQGQKSFS